MTKFGLDAYIAEFPNWAKHHKTLSIQVKREYSDGRDTAIPDTEELLALIEKHEDKLVHREVSLYNSKTDDSYTAIDYYLPLTNLEYIERNLDQYHVGSMNTSHTINVRLIFKVDEVDVILNHSYKTAGSYAMSFYSLIDGDIKDLVRELAEDDKFAFEDKGIQLHEFGYHIIGANEYHRPVDFEIEERELLESLVAVEVYEHEMIIEERIVD